MFMPNDRYRVVEDNNISYIYSNEYNISKIKSFQKSIIKKYEDEFDFRLDDKLYVGLASQNNQISNAFSTQIPFNSQVLYGAGVLNIDYFCFNSWLKMVISHETAHNFQLNPKANKISNISHKILGNSPVSFIGIFPIFPIPNIMINSFLLEGNAVLNESRFNNGGRLYSGYALSEVVSMARDGKIRAELIYNNTLEFPYGEKSYLIGGFFQRFLMEKYGIKRVNRYFKIYSKELFPFYVNSSFKENFGKSFETLLKEFVNNINSKYRDYRVTKGKIIAKSQFFVHLNRSKSEIYTLIGDYRSYPKILSFRKDRVTFKRDAYRVGKPFKIDGIYYTASSAKISPTKIKVGLFNSSAYIKYNTIGRVVEGFLPNGKMVYFDINKSLDIPHIYIDNRFYDTANSSVYISDKGDLYYFKQKDNRRTLYKNRKAIFSYEGHYGFVTDIDGDSIYFISLTKNGSGIYSYRKGKIYRVSSGDDIIDFKKIDNKRGFVSTITSKGYLYQIINLKPKLSKISKPNYITSKIDYSKIEKDDLKSKEYSPIKELRYSSLTQNMGYSDYEGFILNLKVNFYDPAMQNSLSTILSSNKQRVIGGLSYKNSANLLEFGGDIYGVSHNKDYNNKNEDDYGYLLHLKLPFLAKGYNRAYLSLNYLKEYDSIYRKPLMLSLDISNIKWFGISKYPNSKNIFKLSLSKDRDSLIYGTTYDFLYGLDYQSYIGFNGTILKSNKLDSRVNKGIKIDSSLDNPIEDNLIVIMPTLDRTLYAKEAKSAEFSLYKSIDTPLYFFSFPISIQRNSLYIKEKIYNIEYLNSNKIYNQETLGLESDFILFNNLKLPIKFEYLYNKDTKDKTLFRFMFAEEF